jgi:molybdopterin converting factor small subunit
MNQLENQEMTSSKAGRHRLYSNEQRKDRNRQAQAAFRDRRSKYTKTLEVAILKFEDTIEELKETNTKSIQRAELAEEQCSQLNSEVNNLQKLLQMALAENQRLLQSKDYFLTDWIDSSTN